jgi:hypothetical protein
MKKPNNSKKATPAKKGTGGELEGKKALKLKPIKSKEVKRSKNPRVFEDDDEELFEGDLTGLDDFGTLDLDDDDDF